MNRDVRPLDRLRSIKTKLGLLVVITITASSTLAVLGTRAGLSPWVTVAGAVLVSLGITQVLARGMTSPLREMTAAARRMADGDYSQRVTATSGDEVGELARAFNRMAETLEFVDRERQDLVANVSHELRTPLSALRAVLENLVDGVTEPDPGTLKTALTQTERLGRLITDLLDLSRVDAGVVPLDTEEVDVAALVRSAIGQARVDGVTYVADVEPDLTTEADPERLHQLLANLLDNAGRHSPQGGQVRVRAAAHAEAAGDTNTQLSPPAHVVIDVSDDGPGIPAHDRAAVFERFTTSSAHSSGTGLGLAISRWVAQLHGGSIAVADTHVGCTIRVTLPRDSAPPTRKDAPVMSSALTPPAQAPARPAPPPGAGLLATWWPEQLPARPLVVLAAALAGALAAVVLPDHDIGLGTVLVFAAVCGVVLWVRRRPSTRSQRLIVAGDVTLTALLLSTLMFRDAEWITVLCLLAALGLVVVSITRPRTVLAALAGAAAVPLASVRGMPWLGRSLQPARDVSRWLPIVRTLLVSLVLLLVFGALFASADPVFARWVDVLTPDITLNDTPARVVLATLVAGGTLAAAYVSMAPPVLDRVGLPARPAASTFEWAAPLLVVNATFAVFLAAQATALFGGHDYLQDTVGLTYAEYVHQGFGQLTVATALTLAVVAWVAKKTGHGPLRDSALGALCVMTLIVVVSALYRMHVYEEAFGFTRLRLLVSVFEGWLGLLVVLVIVAGMVRHRGWLVPVALRTGAAALLGLALLNPDLWIARHNIDRADTAAVPVDWAYLGELSADAAPAIWELPPDAFRCVTYHQPGADPEDGWLSWNAARAEAQDLRSERAADPMSPSELQATCEAARASSAS